MDFRAEDIDYYYYVNFHEKYGYSVARKAKTTTTTQSANNDINNINNTRQSQTTSTTSPHPHQQQLTMEQEFLQKILCTLERIESNLQKHKS